MGYPIISTKRDFASVNDIIGRSLPSVSRWEELDLNYKIVARRRAAEVRRLRLCYVAAPTGRHQSIAARPEHGRTHVEIIEDTCVGCNLCSLVCPVDGCISMVRVGHRPRPLTWKEYRVDPSAHKHLGRTTLTGEICMN